MPRADHVIVATEDLARPTTEPIEIEVISDKSRDPLEYRFDTGDQDDFRKQVQADAQEAIDEYGGQVEIRSPKFGGRLNGRTATVRRIALLYDDAALDSAAKSVIQEEADAFGVQVIFSDDIGISR